MTIRNLIKELLTYPNLDAQILDIHGCQIMNSRYFEPRTTDDICLIPKSEINIKEALDKYNEEMIDCAMSDKDALDELFDRGFTLKDLKEYRQDTYEWALDILNEE